MTIHEPLVLGPQFAEFADDTEESVSGSSAHQDAIVVLYDGLGACGRGRGLPWFVGNQMRMIIHRVGQRSLSLSPDILVHPTLGFGSRESILVVTDGPPALVIEIASPSTAMGRDLDEGSANAKPAAYAALGIPEYLVFDPTAAFVKDLLWARRLGPHGYEPWEPEADGRWHSALGVSFLIQNSLLRVYDQDGELVPTGPELREYSRRLAALAEERATRLAEQTVLAMEQMRLLQRQASQLDEQAALLQRQEGQLGDQAALLRQQSAQVTEQERRIVALEAELRRLRGE